VNEGDYRGCISHVNICENRRMKPVEIVLRRVGKEEEGWRG
jgi:hypothetical protein